jgi:hypothetical protein
VRKSTVVIIAILIFGAIATTWAFKLYTDQIVEEIRHAKELTDDFRDSLAKDAKGHGTKIRLRRTAGGPPYVVTDPNAFGLLVDANPDLAVLKRDATGFLFAREVAQRAFELYGADRPIQWVEVRLTRPDGTSIPSIGLQRGEGTLVIPIESTRDTDPKQPVRATPPTR